METTQLSWASVKDAGVCANKNQKHRRRMEDEHVLIDKFGGLDSQAFFGVYDGHVSQSAATYCKNHLHLAFEEELKKFSDKVEELLNEEVVKQIAHDSYKKTDDAMKATVPAAGACVVTAIILSVNNQKYLLVANAGDARAVISKAGTAERLTFDHKSSDPNEKQRILDQKGFIDESGRVNGLIAVTRAMGDHNMKGPGKDFIICDPHVKLIKILPEHDFLILACDGFWDVVEDQAGIDLVKNSADNCTNKAKTLVSHALKAGSTDNVSVIVVQL